MNTCIRINRKGDVTIDQCPMPQRKEGEALLKVLYGGICGSDLNSYRGSFAYVTYPRIPGHEFSAEIVEIGGNAQGLKEGMIVTCNPYFNCGECYSCKRGLVNCCENNQTMGVQRDGAFCRYITMPVERIIDGEGLCARTLTLVEPFCISYHGVKKADVKQGEKVLVVGGGTIGLLAAIAARQMGAEVTVCDVARGKLDFAKAFGIHSQLLNDEPDRFGEKVRGLTAGNGFDVTVEAVGLPSTFQNCIDAAAFGGRMVQIGVGTDTLDFNFTLLQKKELSIFGSRNATSGNFRRIIRMIRESGLDLERIITLEYPFDQAPGAFAEYDRKIGQELKVVLKF